MGGVTSEIPLGEQDIILGQRKTASYLARKLIMSRWYRGISPVTHIWNRCFTWLYFRGLGLLAGHSFLLLETTGRSTGKKRLTPLGYVLQGHRFILQPLHGAKSHWIRNLKANSEVIVRIGRNRMHGTATVLSNTEDRRGALEAIASSNTSSGLIARKHFSLLLTTGPQALERANHDLSKAIIVVEVHGLA
jgi:deazaflavin-dependent oxidoreductase (nitroreductase family)